MSEIHNGNPDSLPPLVTPDYAEALVSAYTCIESNLVSNDVRFGPTYHIPEYKGRNWQAITMLLPTMSEDGQECIGIDMLVLDTNNYPLAGRSVAVELNRQCAQATGMVMTGVRNIGLASVVEAVNTDMLQRVINELGDLGLTALRYEIMNANLQNLQQAEIAATMKPTSENIVEVNRRRIEQARWQNVYGTGGKFGAQNHERFFTPDPTGERTNTSRQVTLARQGGQLVVQCIEPLSPPDADRHQLHVWNRMHAASVRMRELIDAAGLVYNIASLASVHA